MAEDATLLSRACRLLFLTPRLGCEGAGSFGSFSSGSLSCKERGGRAGVAARGFGGLRGSISLSGRLGEPGVWNERGSGFFSLFHSGLRLGGGVPNLEMMSFTNREFCGGKRGAVAGATGC
jgi:hypothetical protein